MQQHQDNLEHLEALTRFHSMNETQRSVLIEALKQQRVLLDFLEQQFPSYSYQFWVEFCSKLRYLEVPVHTILFSKGQPNEECYFLLGGQVQVFYDRDPNKPLQTTRPEQTTMSLATICNIKKRFSTSRNIMKDYNNDEQLKRSYQERFGNFSKTYDKGSVLEEKAAFTQASKVYTAITFQHSTLVVLSSSSNNELHALYENEMKAKKKFLIGIFGDSISLYDQNALNYQIYNFREVYLSRGQTLYTQGDQRTMIYLVYQGEVALTQVLRFVNELKQEQQLDRQICLLGASQFLNEESMGKGEPSAAYTVTASTTSVVLLEIKKDQFYKLPHNVKLIILESLKQKRKRRLEANEEFEHQDWKQSMVNVVVGTNRKYHQNRKQAIKESQDPMNQNLVNLEQYMNVHPNSNGDLNSLFRTQVNLQLKQSKSEMEYKSVESFVDILDDFKERHIGFDDDENRNKLIIERFDFGNGDIEKQEKQEHYFKIAKSKIRRTKKYLFTNMQDNYLHDIWNKVESHMNRKRKQSMKYNDIQRLLCIKTQKVNRVSHASDHDIRYINTPQTSFTNNMLKETLGATWAIKSHSRVSIRLSEHQLPSSAQTFSGPVAALHCRRGSGEIPMLTQKHQQQMKLKKSINSLSNIRLRKQG